MTRFTEVPTSRLPRMNARVLPPRNIRFMGEDDDTFVQTARDLADLLYHHGLGTDSRLLDVGSGYGRLAFGLQDTGYAGRYLGFDILPKHVQWCRKNLADGDRYRFRHLDVINDRYNPGGTIPADQVRFPCGDGSQTFLALFSVFTHFYEADIRRYLDEFARVLVPGGTAAATFFLYDDARLATVTDPGQRYPLVHELNDYTRYTSTDDPLLCIGYHEDAVRRMVAEAGLTVERIVRGHWAGDQDPARAAGSTRQDLVIIGRPVPTLLDRVRRRLTR